MNSTIGRVSAAVLLAGLSQAAFIQSVAAQAMIQPQEDARDANDNPDVIVTAQKREQRIEDVPVTVTAVTGARMADLGVNSLSEVAQYIPGLQIQEQSANNPGFVIRGITSDSGSAQQGARVTLYYNGVDISRTRGAYQDLYDIERIEVVKGPQATLFGTAAAIGAINIISAKPRAGTEGGILASYGNFDRTQVSGYLNAGNDTLAGRIAFAYKYRDGYVRNIAGDPKVPNQNQGRVDQDDLNGQDQRGVRGSLRWTPNSSVTADLVLTYDGQRNPGTAFKSRVFAPTGGQTGDYGYAELSGSPFSAEVLGKRKLGLTRNVYDANLTVAVDVAPGITFTTVNGYRRFDSLEIFDADGGPAWYLEFGEDAKGDQWSHESRFAFDGAHYRASFGWNAFFEKWAAARTLLDRGRDLSGLFGRTRLRADPPDPERRETADRHRLRRRQRHHPGDARHRDPVAWDGDRPALQRQLRQLRQYRHLFGLCRRHLDSNGRAGTDGGCARADRGSPVGL